MSEYLGRKGQGYIQQIGFCQRCGWKYLRTELIEDDYIKGLLVCCYCHDPDHPQRYPAAPRAEGQPPLTPAPDQYPGPNPTVLSLGDVGATTAVLNWTPSVDNADLINEYFIYRQDNGVGSFNLIASVPFESGYDFPNDQVEPYASPTTYEDDTLAPNSFYLYYVIAQAVDRRLSVASNQVEADTTFQATAPVLAGELSGAHVILTWTASTIEGSFIDGYQLWRGINGGTPTLYQTLGNVLTYTDANGSFGNLNTYYVIGVPDVGANSPPSNEVALTPELANVTVIVTSATGPFYGGSFETDGTGYTDGGAQPPVSPWPIGTISSTDLGFTLIGSIGTSSEPGPLSLFFGWYNEDVDFPPPNFGSITVNGHTYQAVDGLVPEFAGNDGHHGVLYWTLIGPNPFVNTEMTSVTITGVS